MITLYTAATPNGRKASISPAPILLLTSPTLAGHARLVGQAWKAGISKICRAGLKQ